MRRFLFCCLSILFLFASCTREMAPSITLDRETLDIKVGETGTLHATAVVYTKETRTVSWASVNTAIASVHQGRVIGHAPGKTIITASVGSEVASCDVTVHAIDVTGVTLDKTELTMKEGTSLALTATVSPSDATFKNVLWSSDNPEVATVSSNGRVSAKKAGTATITVTTTDGSKSATCTVTVKPSFISVTGVTLDKTSLTLTSGETETLTATVSPSDATDPSLTWSSNNLNVASVSSTGVVTARKAGTAVITVTTNDGGKTATCTVTVKAPVIPVTGVTLDKTSLTLTEGETQALTATVSPSNASDKTVSWLSNNTTVATVSSDGVVTAKKAGTATITVTTVDGDKIATCSVTVKSKDVGGSGNEGTGEEILF